MEGLWRAQAEAKRKVDFRGSEKRGDETSNGMVCGSQQVSMHEVWEKQQTQEDARQIHRTKLLVIFFFGKLGKRHLGGHHIWFEEWIDREKFCSEGAIMTRKGSWKLAGEKVLQDRGEWSEEEGDVIREFQATPEENSLSSWLREDGKNKEEIIGEVGKETEEETGEKRISEEEREENETVIVNRRCIDSVSTEAFEIFCQGEMSENDGNSRGDLWDDLCGGV